MFAKRWGDNDRYWGPFTYSREGKRGYRHLALVLCSGHDEYPGCSLRLSGFGHTFIIALPQIIKPWRQWVNTSRHEWSGPNGGFWDEHQNKFGISYSDGFLQVFLGPQTMDSSTTKSWSKFLPWTQWRHIRHSFYGLNGEHVATLPDTGKSYRLDPDRREREREIEAATPTISFDFRDFDQEQLVATTKIEEREWRFGTGWFKWLSIFRNPKIQRSLNISFSGETGHRKGSWKGGTIGHSILMKPGELHEAAFRRYCAGHEMEFIDEAKLDDRAEPHPTA